MSASVLHLIEGLFGRNHSPCTKIDAKEEEVAGLAWTESSLDL